MAERPPRRCVLIVEDDDNIATALEYVISREGLDQDRVGNGADAAAGAAVVAGGTLAGVTAVTASRHTMSSNTPSADTGSSMLGPGNVCAP